jgi:hypothetical protein
MEDNVKNEVARGGEGVESMLDGEDRNEEEGCA